MMPRYTILRDTRERESNGWFFDNLVWCVGTIRKKLDTGDYTIQGYENVIALERKGTVTEWAGNVTQPRFYKELERLRLIKYTYILLEFNMYDMLQYPTNLQLPTYALNRIKVGGEFLLKKTLEIQRDYGVNILLCGCVGREVAISIFKRFIDREVGQRKT
jgi:hypothetical protein